MLHSPFYTAIPWLAVTVSDLIVGGWLVDPLIRPGTIRRGCDRPVLVFGPVLGLAAVSATRTSNPLLQLLASNEFLKRVALRQW